MKKSSKQSRPGTVHTAMGRRVEYHSPAKHPEQRDEVMSEEEYERMLREIDKGRQSGTLGGMRKDLKPAQRGSSDAAKRLQFGIDVLTDTDYRKRR